MLSDLLWLIILIIFCFFGLKRPYIALSAVIFVDLVKPQNLSFSFLSGQPLSLILTLVFFFSMLINKSGWSIPNRKAPTFLLILLMIWITITTIYAEFQFTAWFKHDYSMKTIFFAIFIPFVINTRVKIEYFITTMVSAIAYFIINGGMKTLFGTTAYGAELVYAGSGDSGIAESSTLSMVSVFVLPFIYYLYQHSSLAKVRFIKIILLALCLSAILTIIGSHARTGLVGLFILFGLITLQTKYKFKVIFAGIIISMLIFTLAPKNWLDRMSTISTAKSDSSAVGRLVVWEWTIDYVANKPLGGGFTSFQANAGKLHAYVDEDVDIYVSQNGKAYHNVFFEVLGEHGYTGLLIYLLIIFTSWKAALSIQRNKNNDNWSKSLASLVNYSLLIFCACGMFIGIAFAPWLYYFVGITGGLNNIVNKQQKTS
jgi:probable O-glycosylation ligase (exosortase A-associated)